MGEVGFGAGNHGDDKPPKPAKKGKTKATAKRVKKGEGKKPLDPRRARYVKARKAGKTKMESALVAGFSPSIARKAGERIETTAVKAEIAKFQDDICAAFPNERLIQTLDAGLEATVVKVASIEGKITDIKAFVDHTERRQTVELIAEMSGRLKRKGESSQTVNMPVMVVHSVPRPERGNGANGD